MKANVYLTACLFASCALAAAGLLCLGRNAEQAAGRSLQDAQCLSRRLDEKLAVQRAANVAKEELTAAVIGGRRTLLEAAAAFQALDARNRDFQWEVFCRSYRGGSAGERYCRAVLRWVEQRLPEGSSQAEQLLARLEAELQAHLRQHGTVFLPPA